ncbi:MAG: helix-turn-helix domain-containing protein [Clostridiales bacterium]|nr:helix-turn-helix domain-containing protein [Clostridiales bacterium]
MDKLTFSVSEVAVQLGISKPLAYNLCSSAGFPALRLGRRILIPVDGFHKWLESQVALSG